MRSLTFLFTDAEGSTALHGRPGEDIYAQVLAGHHALLPARTARQPRPATTAQALDSEQPEAVNTVA